MGTIDWIAIESESIARYSPHVLVPSPRERPVHQTKSLSRGMNTYLLREDKPNSIRLYRLYPGAELYRFHGTMLVLCSGAGYLEFELVEGLLMSISPWGSSPGGPPQVFYEMPL